MTDTSNIDDILKSIDALLKEGEPEPGRDGKPDRALNDEDIIEQSVVDEMPDADENKDIPGAGKPSGHSDAESVEASPETVEEPLPDTDEMTVHENDETTDAIEEGAGKPSGIETAAGDVAADEQEVIQQNSPALPEDDESDHSVKRIVLSEAMQVEDSPELPLGEATHEDIADEETPPDDAVAACEKVEQAAAGNGQVTEEAGPFGDTREAAAEAAANADEGSDMAGLAQQITDEVSGQLLQKLPAVLDRLVADAVSEAVARHLPHGNSNCGGEPE